jgi:hypothetical protein
MPLTVKTIRLKSKYFIFRGTGCITIIKKIKNLKTKNFKILNFEVCQAFSKYNVNPLQTAFPKKI